MILRYEFTILRYKVAFASCKVMRYKVIVRHTVVFMRQEVAKFLRYKVAHFKEGSSICRINLAFVSCHVCEVKKSHIMKSCF